MRALAGASLLIPAAPGAAHGETAIPPDINDIRDLSDLAETAIAVEDVGVLQVGQDGKLTATSVGILMITPPPWQRSPGDTGLVSAASQTRRTQASQTSPASAFQAFPGLAGIKTISHGSSVEIREVLRGLVIRAGQLWVPMGAQAARPAYFVFDHRPGWFWTAAQPREMGVEASYRPIPNVGFTLGGYNNKGSYKFGTLVVKAAIGRLDVNLGLAKAGSFFYYGTGRWWGDSTRAGADLRTKLGSVEVSGQILRGAYNGVQQAGWYVDLRHDLKPGTTVIARFDEHNPNVLAYSGLDSHVTLALMHRPNPVQTVKLNLQMGISDPQRVRDPSLPSVWAIIGQLWQRF